MIIMSIIVIMMWVRTEVYVSFSFFLLDNELSNCHFVDFSYQLFGTHWHLLLIYFFIFMEVCCPSVGQLRCTDLEGGWKDAGLFVVLCLLYFCFVLCTSILVLWWFLSVVFGVNCGTGGHFEMNSQFCIHIHLSLIVSFCSADGIFWGTQVY